MRTIPLCVILILVVCFLAVSAPAAGKGAAVYRGNDAFWLWFDWDETVSGPREVLYWSTYPDWGEAFFCDYSELPDLDMRWQWVVIPSGELFGYKNNGNFFGPQYARVLYLDPDNDIPWDDICGFIQGDSFASPIAEGMVQFHVSDINSCNLGPGRNTWFWRVNGELVDLREDDACESGEVNVKMLDHWQLTKDAVPNPDCEFVFPDDYIHVKRTPPTLTCKGE